MNELPDGWRAAKLGELCNLVNGDAYRDTDWSTSGVPIIRIQNLNDHAKPFNYWAESLDDRVIVNSGDVLLAWSGTPGTSFGTHRWDRGLGVLNQHIFRVDLNLEKIDPDWAVFAINEQLDEMIGKAHGAAGLRHVTKGEVQKLAILLPPLPEQRRIAGVLREQMAAVTTARRGAEAQLEAAQALPAAYLRGGFESAEAKAWPKKQLKEICCDITDGTHVTPTYISQGVPFLSVKDVKEERLSFDDCRFISEEEHRKLTKRCKPERGDVLYTKVGTTGIAKAVDVDREFSIFVSVALLKLDPTVAPEYLEKVLNSPICREQAADLTQGMANRNLVLRDLMRIELPLPPLVAQRRIAAELAERLAGVERLRRSLAEQLAAIEKLPAALLRRAFAGEL